MESPTASGAMRAQNQRQADAIRTELRTMFGISYVCIAAAVLTTTLRYVCHGLCHVRASYACLSLA
jgi:hypothetical protein